VAKRIKTNYEKGAKLTCFQSTLLGLRNQMKKKKKKKKKKTKKKKKKKKKKKQ